ncbi:cell division protein FtsZ [Candidatus Sumerlaeota bacterium]|nr:cell division protein FtsZ [Candidatus Sumerlaeota bacterium]
MTDVPFEVVSDEPRAAVIKVIGSGGGGSNAVDSMIKHGIDSVEYFVVNTDAKALSRSMCQNKIQIGVEITNGLGSGGDPAVGKTSAEAAENQLREALAGADMVFLTAGLGGGTGTGASPVIARIAKEIGALTVAIMTKPFRFEGPQRMRRAMQGVEQLREFVDTLILISNDRLLEVIDRSATLVDAFNIANGVLCQGVQSISDLISEPGLINVDFADVRTIMGGTHGAVMGIGVGRGDDRAVEAVNKACASPLLDKIVIDGARGVLISICGGPELKLLEVNEAMTLVYEKADPEANIIFGAVIDEKMKDEVRVTIIATGFLDDEADALPGKSKYAAPQAQAKSSEVQDEAPRQPLKSPTSPVSLKSKLESMIGKEASPQPNAKARPEAPKTKETDTSSVPTPTPSDVKIGTAEIEMDFTDEDEESPQESKQASDNEDPDIPAYLRNKDLLD